MRKLFGLCALLSLGSCLDEQRVEPAKPSTFVRYINGGMHDTAKAMEKTSDGGYIILANTSVLAPTVPISQNTIRIKLVKVNAYGTVEWSQILPVDAAEGVNYVGNGISITPTGYIISGEVIQSTGQSRLLITQVVTNQNDGTVNGTPTSFSPDFPKASGDGVNVSGLAAAELPSGRLLVLGSITGHPQNMILAEINTGATPPTVTWDWPYGSGPSTLLNKIFLDANNNVIFGGTVTRPNSLTDLRLVKAAQNAGSTNFDLPYGDPDLSEKANGICRTADGFAMIGSSNVAGKQDRDILFARFSNSGTELFNRTYPVYYPGTNDDVRLDDEGNSVCTTSDNGFIILATVISATSVDNTIGRGENDYYLMKVNAFGDVQWARAFGSRRNDTGVSVLQADDGGFVILGTTQLANVATIALIKTDASGEID